MFGRCMMMYFDIQIRIIFLIRLNVLPPLIMVGCNLVGGNPVQPITIKQGTNAIPIPLTTPLYAVKHIYYWGGKNHKDTFVYRQRDHLCFGIVTLKNDTHPRNPLHRVVSTYHKPRLQQCIQRMQPTKGTHHWLHSSQRVETHTCHPGKKKRKDKLH